MPACSQAVLLLVVVARDDPHHRHLLAGLHLRIHDISADAAAEPRPLGLADEDRSALRSVVLLDPDLLTFAQSVHRLIVPDQSDRRRGETAAGLRGRLGRGLLPCRTRLRRLAGVLTATYSLMRELMAIRVCVFDVYGTLVDVESAVGQAARTQCDHTALVRSWRLKQLEYSWTRSLMGRHADFEALTQASLDWAMAALGLTDPHLRADLLDAYTRLDAHPDAALPASAAGAWRPVRGFVQRHARHARPGARHSGLAPLLADVLSIEEVGVYKPDPRVYRLAVDRLGAESDEVAFVSSNAWDAAGAATAGFAVHWINRGHMPDEYDLRGSVVELESLAPLPALIGA